MVFVEAWGAGGGGASLANGGGGGGGHYVSGWFRVAGLPSSVAVTIGAGGPINGNGGDTSFGAILLARGGLGTSTANGGPGAGTLATGRLGGGVAGVPTTSITARGGDAQLECGGGGAVGGGGVGSGPGGAAIRGGGGGAAAGAAAPTTNVGGVSIFAGKGGDSNTAGTAPAGGGGRNAPGARGEIRVWI